MIKPVNVLLILLFLVVVVVVTMHGISSLNHVKILFYFAIILSDGNEVSLENKQNRTLKVVSKLLRYKIVRHIIQNIMHLKSQSIA